MYLRHLAAGVLAATLLTAVGQAEAAQPLCRGVKGKRVVSSLRIVVVDRTHRTPSGRTSHAYTACALSEKPRKLTASVPGGALRFGNRTDLYVVVRDAKSGRQSVWDLATGAHPPVRFKAGRVVGDALVGATGEFAAIVDVGAERRVVGFERDGTGYAVATTTGSTLRQDAGNHDVLSFTGGRLHLDALPVPCASLRGKDMVPDPGVKVVAAAIAYHGGYEGDSFGYSRIDSTGTRLRGCVMPDGVARTLGEGTSDDYSGGSVSLEAAAGHFVLVNEQGGNSTGDFSFDQRTLVNLGTGVSKEIWGSGTEAHPNKDLEEPGAFSLAPGGQSAAIFDTGPVSVVAFGADAEPHVLDQADQAKIGERLSLAGSVLSWTHGGRQRSADLSPF